MTGQVGAVANIVQICTGAASGAHDIGNSFTALAQAIPQLAPAAQQQMLQQILQSLNQTQQTVQQIQQSQQQMQQGMQQMQQDMQLGFSNMEFNTAARVMNSQLNNDRPVWWLRNAAGQVPQQQVATANSVRAATTAALVPVLQHYGLAINGSLNDKRQR